MLKTVKPLRDELAHIKKKTEEEMEEVMRFMSSRIEDLVNKLSDQKEINISIKTDLSSEAAKLKKSNDENAALKGQVRHLQDTIKQNQYERDQSENTLQAEIKVLE